jgi:hypothetical protein
MSATTVTTTATMRQYGELEPAELVYPGLVRIDPPAKSVINP